ncbi:MAG: hypothetical protein M1836_000816 [Candelina mexicana]|nr:MAG: hypothetical protein M1836_000816 [Candelina mexicana]
MTRLVLLSTTFSQFLVLVYFMTAVNAFPPHVNHLSKRSVPTCLDTMGHPTLEDCELALDSFWVHMVLSRGYEADEEIEFLAPGAQPMNAHRMPREVMSPNLYTFKGSEKEPTCIIMFGMMTGFTSDTAIGSLVSSFEEMNATAHGIIRECVANHELGGSALVDADWERPRIIAHVFAATKDDPRVRDALQETLDYSMKDNYHNKELLSDAGGIDIDEEISAAELQVWGDPGQGSSTDPGNTFMQAYCNAKSTESCWPGWGCKAVEMAEMAKTVVWGFVKDRGMDFVGTCAMVVAS